MSLDFDFKNVKNFKEVTTSPFDSTKWHPVADALVWLSMHCGYNKITESNAGQIARRISQYQLIFGPYLRLGDGTKVYVTKLDVQRFIGLRTNATAFTDAAWRTRLSQYMMDTILDGTWPGTAQGRSALDAFAAAAMKVKQQKQRIARKLHDTSPHN